MNFLDLALKKYIFFIAKCASLAAIVAFAVFLLDFLQPSIDTLSSLVDQLISKYGILGMLTFVFLCAILSCFFVPRQVLSFVSGYAYGAVLGTLIVTFGVSIGCLCTFLYTRFIAQNFIQKKFGMRIAWLEHLFSKSPLGMAISIRIIPVGSNVLLNMVAGVSKIPLIPFCLGSAIGYIPQNLIFALLGTGVRVDPLLRTGLAGALYVGGIIGGLWLFKIFRPSKNTNLKYIVRSIFKPNSD